MITVLINDTVKKNLLKQPTDIRNKIRDKFEFLESGIWDGGLKVKKLKGSSDKYIFEARLDRSNRIIFTLGQGQPQGPGQENALIIYVWGIVTHDDIPTKVKTIIPANATFLLFEEYQETLLENVDIEELESDYFTQEGVNEKNAGQSGSQRWYAVDEPEWQRIRMYSRDDFDLFLQLTPEQDEILSTPLPMMISGTAGSGKTSLAVYYLLNRNLDKKKKLFLTYNIHLKNFAVKLYNGLLNERPGKKEITPPDFYTFKELCLDVAGKDRFSPGMEVDFNQFNRLFTGYPGYQSYDVALVWEEIRAIIKGAVPGLNLPMVETGLRQIKKGALSPEIIRQLQEQFILFSKLESFQRVDKVVKKYLDIDIETFAANIGKYLHAGMVASSTNDREKENMSAILEKTVDILKKEQNNNGRKYLSFAEYEILGKKKAPNFRFNRGDIYRIFEWYQNELETGGLWDELDMMPTSIPPKYTYDILVCDEVQDLTDTQLDLLFNFVKNPKNIFLAGDTRQTINPSGFRWEEVRKHFYERGLEVPELKTLSLNFRSSGSIIELSNTLLELKEKFMGRNADEPRENWKYKGRPVTVVTGIETGEMLEILKAAGVERTILVRTDAEKEFLQNILGTELIFTIKEAKGLEFDTVVLWKFCDDPSSGSEDVWRATLELSDRNVHEARIKHEINLLYVGITRCQKDLIVYDGVSPSLIWESEPVKDNIYITNDRCYLEKVWNVISSPQEWVEQGHYFFNRGYYKAAAECYKNGGDSQNLAKARAYYFAQIGNYHEAAANFAGIGEIEKAALNYENAGAYKDALGLWEKLNRQDKIVDCTAALLGNEGKFREAGNLYLKTGNYNAAVEYFKKAGNDRTVAEIYLNNLNNIELAAQYFEYSRDYDNAAALYARLDMFDKAAELYFQAKKYVEAETLWEKTGSSKNLLELYRRTGKHDKIFTIHEQENNLEKALKYLETLKIDKKKLLEEGEELFQGRRYFQALIRFLAVEEAEAKSVNRDGTDGPETDQGNPSTLPGKIAECYYQLGKHESSIPYYINAGDFYSAARVYDETGDYENAFAMYFDSAQDKADGFAMARQALNKVTNTGFLRKLALGYYFDRDYERAMFLFTRLEGFAPLEGICYALAGEKLKAFDKWQECRYYGELTTIAEECLQKDIIDIGAQYFLGLPSREDSFEPDIFSKSLEKTCIEDLMKSYFGEHVSFGNREMNWDIIKTHKEETRIWGFFILRHDVFFKNASAVQFYLAFNGEYNALLMYYIEKLKSYPEKAKDILHAVSHNSACGANNDEFQVFRLTLKDKAMGLDDDDRRNLESFASKVVVRENNFTLLVEAPVSEEIKKKVDDWGEESGFVHKKDDYFRELLEKITINLKYLPK
ncbi:MAG: hypothetical protein QG657_2538 [Acidobacteriota bacterium]|nr:hypothetical protein [Acidobacteriota bacterium]